MFYNTAYFTVTIACVFQQSDQCVVELFQASLAFCLLQIDLQYFFSLPEEVDVKDTINTCQSSWTLRWVTDIESPLSVL